MAKQSRNLETLGDGIKGWICSVFYCGTSVSECGLLSGVVKKTHNTENGTHLKEKQCVFKLDCLNLLLQNIVHKYIY